MRRGQCFVMSARHQADGMPAGSQRNSQPHVGKDIAVGAYRSQNNMHVWISTSQQDNDRTAMSRTHRPATRLVVRLPEPYGARLMKARIAFLLLLWGCGLRQSQAATTNGGFESGVLTP